MKNALTLLTLTVFLILSGCLPATETPDATPVSWLSFDEGMNLAQKSGKKIMVHVYTDWCEYCKKLESDVYPDESVTQTINRYFVPVKLNADALHHLTYKGKQYTQEAFALEMGIKSYPTILFFDSNGDIILQINGFMPIHDFQNMLAYIGEEAFMRTEFHEFASQGNR